MPGGTYFLYTPAPRGGGRPDVRDGRDVSEFLIRDRSICTVPWDDAARTAMVGHLHGPHEADEDALMESLKQRLAATGSHSESPRVGRDFPVMT